MNEETAVNTDKQPRTVSESFGDPHLTVLLIMGAMASMLWWPEAFCRKVAGEGRFVIRYDNRDTRRSTKYPIGAPPYTFEDMADDAVRVLDDHGVGKAHVAGMSMGGMIAQRVALKHPRRVLSLTVTSSSPLGLPQPDTTCRRLSLRASRVVQPPRTGRARCSA